MKRKLFKLFTIVLMASFVFSPAIAQTPTADQPPKFPVNEGLEPVGDLGLGEKFSQVEPDEVINFDKVSRYIVLFEDESLVVHQGAADRAVDPEAYLEELASKRTSTLAAAEATIGRSIEVRYVYDVILNGVSVEMTRGEALQLENVPGIRKVLLDTTETLDTDAGPAWIGADTIWDGSAVPDAIGNKGEGILVGMIDSGINFDHPSFSDTPADSFVYEWAGDYLGVCAPGADPNYAAACNDKLVGAYTYTDDNPAEPITPEDSNGHGTHTASTVAGNAVETEFMGETVTVSGMAPHAQIIAYDACYPTPTGGSCAGEDLLAAVQQAVLDGVDIINYSISGGENPYGDAVELAFLEAFDAGVVVSASAGNSGPDAGTVGHRSPWVITTAASTHNRKFTSQVNFSDPLYQGIATLAGELPFTTEFVGADVKFAGEDGNPLGCLDPGYTTDNFYDGAVALIQRGTCTFTEKVVTAEAYGASAVLVFTDDRAPGAMAVDGSTVPNVMLDISGVLGLEIANWVTAQTDETVDISTVGYYLNDAYGDIMADFSSRGPNNTFDVLKPDVTAPGVEILAAVQDGTIAPSPDAEFDLYQGTSMSSPHDAGAAALLYAQHPTWTPAMIKSALMLTAYDELVKEDKTTPADLFDIGAGHVRLEMAGLIGLAMDETYDNMLAADPSEGGDVKTLNIPSLYNSQCVGECSWTRTFTSVAGVSATYTVTAPDWITVDPVEFTIDPGATQEITITADVAGLTADEWAFGNIEFNTLALHTGGKEISDVAVPAAVLPVAANLPEWVSFESHRDADSDTISDLIAVEITDLTVDTYGFVKGEPIDIELAEDPTNGDAFDDLSQVWYTTIDMTNGAARAVAEITASTAPDVDLFWGFDVNDDGMPQSGELYESSATATAFEYLSDWGFPPGFYDVWVLVQNWTGSGTATDDITLTLGVVPWEPVAPPTMTVLGPETNPAGVPFELDVLWHDIDTEEGDRLYGMFDAYADAAYATWIGLTEVDVVRGADDVVKTADVEMAEPGDTVTYTITINNFSTNPLEYTIYDVLPEGVTYVPDSVTGGAVYDDGTNAITWSGTVEASYRDYVATTSAEDPACTLAIMADGDPTDAYLDWKTTSYGFSANSSIFGEFWYGGFSDYEPFNYYGIDYTGMDFTDDARVGFDMLGYDYINQEFPNPAEPNNTLGMFWDDFVVQYDAATNKGVSLVGDGESFATVEYDDIYLYDFPEYTMDVEIGFFLQPDDTPGAYEVVYAYDNITPGFFDVATGTIGMENVDGTQGTTFSYNDTELTIADGSAICFDWKLLAAPPKEITFQVTVDAESFIGEIVNEALHDNDHLGTDEESALATFALPAIEPVINEYLADHSGSDVVEYVEIFGTEEIDYSAYTVLEIEGDSGSTVGYIDHVIPVGTTDINGLYLASLNANDLENGTISLLLVKDFTGAYGEDIDTDDDGVIDYEPWSAMVDSVGVFDGGVDDIAYGPTILEPYFDGFAYDPGGASRIPDGYDTDAPSDWVRNDYDGAGLPGFTGTPEFGEAYNTPGDFNRIVPINLYLPIILR